MTEPILRDDIDGIARLTLNGQANYNALSFAMIDALSGALDDVAQDDSVRVVVLRGAGKAFCAGHDLREMQGLRDGPDGGAARFRDLFGRCASMMQAITALPQPVIAQVHGIATAAGCQLAATCDLVVAATGTRFGVNGVNIGLFCTTPMVALTRAIPPKAAFEMLVTGEFVDADRARDLGLVNRVVPAQDLEAATMALARTIAAKLPAAVRLGKRAFHDQVPLGIGDAYAAAGPVMCENVLLPDTAEGIAAFLEKRPPHWA